MPVIAFKRAGPGGQRAGRPAGQRVRRTNIGARRARCRGVMGGWSA